MDPTSLVLYAIELHDIRKDKDEAYECFVYVTPMLKSVSCVTDFPIQTSMAPWPPPLCYNEIGDSLSTYSNIIGPS
jgi:hypothetical protein